MIGWVLQQEDNELPTWLTSELPNVCKYCGSPMENYYNNYGRCTNRRCSNEHCYGFTASKADFVRKMLGIAGVGFEGCLKDAIDFKVKTPFELLHLWGYRPNVSLGTFLRMHCFPDIDNEWINICQELNCYTLDELYERYNEQYLNYKRKWRDLLDLHKEEIYENSKYVDLAERPEDMVKKEANIVLNVMVTGTPIGFASKDDFFTQLNAICRGRIVLRHQKTIRKTGVDVLIRENGSTTKGKLSAAKSAGIPILTSEQFILALTDMMNKLNSEQNNSGDSYITE